MREPESSQPPSQVAPGRPGLGLALIVTGLVSLTFNASGVVGERPEQLVNMTRWELEDAAAYVGPITGPIRVDGALVATEALTMPDTGEAVIRGLVKVVLKARTNPDSQAAVADTLFLWEDTAQGVRLAQGDLSLPLDASPLDLPLFYDPSATATVEEEDGVPVAVRYRDARFPIAPRWREHSLEVQVQRAILPARLKVTALTALDGEGAEARLVPLPGQHMTVVEHTKSQVPTPHRGLGALTLVMGMGLIIAGAWVMRDHLRREVWRGSTG